MAEMKVEITDQPIDAAALSEFMHGPENGAVCVFEGTVRNESQGKAVQSLTYEAYKEMAEPLMHQIAEGIAAEWPVTRLALVHRIGKLAICDIAVVVAAGSGHRDAAFAACRAGIDRLKKDVPIWKKEEYADGSAWVGETAGG